MNAIEAARRSMYTSTEPAPPATDRRSITEAASRGVSGSARPSRTSRARSATRPPRRRTERAGGSRSTVGSIPGVGRTDLGHADLCDQSPLDGRVERENGHAHRAAGGPPRLTEHFEQQLAGTVYDLRLLGEAGRAGNEAGHLDHAHHRREATGHRGDGGERVQRTDPR